MSIQQVPAIREQFNANLRHILQQEGSILQKLVRQEMMDHEVEHFTTLETAEALNRDKHADTGYDIADVVAWIVSKRLNEFGQPLTPPTLPDKYESSQP